MANDLVGFDAAAEFERLYVRPRAGRALIAGSLVTEDKDDRRRLYADALGVDMRPGPGVDRVANLEHAEFGPFDHIECRSVLEHTPRPWLMAANLERMMSTGSTLHVAVPFIWREHKYPSDYWRFTTAAIRSLFPGIEWVALMYGNTRLYEDGKVPAMREEGGLPHLCRTEALGFGVRL